MVAREEVVWRVQYVASNPAEPVTLYESYTIGHADIVIRPPPVPKGYAVGYNTSRAAAIVNREARAKEFIRRMAEAMAPAPEPAMPGPTG